MAPATSGHIQVRGPPPTPAHRPGLTAEAAGPKARRMFPGTSTDPASDGAASSASLPQRSDDGGPPARASFLRELYRNHFGELVGRLRKLYGAGPPDPEDMAQAAFEKIAKLEDVSHIHSPRAFLFRTAINLTINARSREKRARAHAEQEIIHFPEAGLEENSPEIVFMEKQAIAALGDALKALPPKQREIILRSRFHGETYAEIRAATGWSEADISRQLARALETLQQALRP